MSTPIPGFATQVIPSSGWTVAVDGGAALAIPTTRYYYLVSPRSSTTNGQSLLAAVKTALDAGVGGVVWTVKLAKVGSLYKVQILHNNGASHSVVLSDGLAAGLGFSSGSFTVAASTTVTADYPSIWWWTPDMPVSLTGPEMFDPSISYGVPESAGYSQRAPDMTTAYGQNGVQWSAEYTFNGVQYLYKIRKQVGHTNEDLESWWQNGPAQGRRILWWRDRDNATGSSTPAAGSASPYNCIEYAPQEALRSKLPATASFPPNLIWWDVNLKLWLTENGEAPPTG